MCGGGGGSRGYAGKVVDINRMTKNPNPGFFLLFPFLFLWGGEGGRAWQGKEVLERELEQLFSYVTHCINLIHIALQFHEDIPYGYRVGLHKNSLRNSSEGCNSKNMGETHIGLKEDFSKNISTMFC